jgi:putative ABC transport system ATP-binding protein
MIELDDVSRTYQEGPVPVKALRPLSITIERGSLVAIIGPSGSGKSTLLNLLGALDRPTTGRIAIDGVDLTHMNDDERTRLRREKIGFVFQFFNLLPTMTAVENALLPAKLAGRRDAATAARAASLLEQVGLGGRLHHLPDQLSGGEMQRVAVARALMMDPPVVLADEPTGNLDSDTGRQVLDLLRGAVDQRRTVILVTHDPQIAAQADRVLALKDGALQSDRAGERAQAG